MGIESSRKLANDLRNPVSWNMVFFCNQEGNKYRREERVKSAAPKDPSVPFLSPPKNPKDEVGAVGLYVCTFLHFLFVMLHVTLGAKQ